MIKRELSVFLIVGALTVLVDFTSYRGLLLLGIMSIELAKAAGSITGTLFAYFANRFWTFGHTPHHPSSVWRFAVLYASTLGANVLVNSLALKLLANNTGAIQLAFLLATSVSASLNFVGMKYFVFKTRPALELQ